MNAFRPIAVFVLSGWVACGDRDKGIDPEPVRNQAPVAAGEIPGANLIEGEAEAVFNLYRYFQDADGDELTYTAVSGDEAVARVALSGSSATITPVSEGNATVTVAATDPGGLSATQRIAVSVEAAAPPLTGPYVPLEWISVSPGRIELRPVSFIPFACLGWSEATVNGVSYRIHFSHWQRRDNSSSPWIDVPGTRKVGEMCGYTPGSSGEYRLVMELSIDGARGRYSSANIIIAACVPDEDDCLFSEEPGALPPDLASCPASGPQPMTAATLNGVAPTSEDRLLRSQCRKEQESMKGRSPDALFLGFADKTSASGSSSTA